MKRTDLLEMENLGPVYYWQGVPHPVRATRFRDPLSLRLIETREPVKPAHRLVRNADGSAVFIVDFPKPSKPPPPEPDVIGPPPKQTKASQVLPVD